MVTYLGKLCLLSNHYTAVVTLVQTLKLSEAPGVPLTNRPATPYDPVGVGKLISHLIADDEENFDEKLLNETNVFCENPPRSSLIEECLRLSKSERFFEE